MPVLRTRDTHSRPLEVSTDAPQPPTVSIISPTPRAFTFPSSHNLSDSPYSSRSSSPFEPEQNPLFSPSTSCITAPTRSLSPSSITSSSPSPSSPSPVHKRRKSSTSLDVDRRPKKGDDNYVKRPENAFILFRRKCCEDRDAAASNGPTKKQRQADLSKTISQLWKSISPSERQHWEELAKEKKREHERLHPGYVYRPQRLRDKDGKLIRKSKSKSGARRGSDFDLDTDTETSVPRNVTFVLPGQRHHGGRSASAPSPASYHTIQIPNVYVTPSCPSSPAMRPADAHSLLPMISRRSSHPGHPEEVMSDFDYFPSESQTSSSFNFESNLQSSDFLRNMFNIRPTASDLEPLELSHESQSLLLPAHQIVSPASSIGSGSSGPSSPRSGPFTPTSASLQTPNSSFLSSFEQLCSTESYSQGMDAQLGMQFHQELDALNEGYVEFDKFDDFSGYSWPQNEVNDCSQYSAPESMWPASNELLLSGDDFDLQSIPPIELGMSKFQAEYQHEFEGQHQFEGQQSSETQLEHESYLGFDDMMAGNGF